jgi:hypothetical protein
MLNCMGTATCHGDCQAQAKASLHCVPPNVTVDIVGDAQLFASFQARAAEIGKAFNDTKELASLILGSGGVASQTESVFTAIGDIGAAGIGCVGSELSVAGNVSASINVSVSASATVSGMGSASSM